MDEIIDDILKAYGAKLDAERRAQSRQAIGQYIAKLSSAGQKDSRMLAYYGLAYLKEMHEGRDRRYTGC